MCLMASAGFKRMAFNPGYIAAKMAVIKTIIETCR